MNGETHLDWLRGRRSVRAFEDRSVPREALERVLEAATTAPSNSNAQPWRFDVVEEAGAREEIIRMVKDATERISGLIEKGPHAEEFGSYGNFFWEPLATAPVIVIPQVREYPDMLARFLSSAGADPEEFSLPSTMQMERCAVGTSMMGFLLQARAEGLGACWMAGPMVARPEIEALLQIRSPFSMCGAAVIGYPTEPDPPATKRRAFNRVVRWR